ncbi:MAG: glycosyl hydrolase [Proteiniphilum sp.]
MSKYRSYTICIILLISCSARIYSLPEWKKKYNDPKVVRTMFVDPPMFYAPHAFWFWDDTIRDEHFAASMIDEMAKQRLNPGYAHPRGSLRIYQTGAYPVLPKEQYLAQPWFNSYGNAVKKTHDYGLTLGYCDEYNWPSGQAAGKVLEQHPELEAKYLEWKRYEVSGKSTFRLDTLDFAVAGKIVDNKIDASSLRIIGDGNNLTWSAPEGKWAVYAYVITSLPEKERVKINYLDSRLMDAFIPLVHEQYEKHFGDEMGKTIPGVFVDHEGNYGWQMAWSDYFAKRYKEIKKQDIRLWLPLLTEKDEAGIFAKARYDWFDVVSNVYKECFEEPVVNWLEQRNMYYISNLWEGLLAQPKSVGDFMLMQRTATMPGNDCLQMSSQNVRDFKETQSVAEFEDRPFMSEIMGVAGWEQTPQMMKKTINSITSFGVNHVVPHGINTNRKLETIPYPADWYTENPYWPYLHYWTDFARRAAFITRQGRVVADVLLMNPLESVWALTEDYFSNEGTQKWDKRITETNRVYSDAMDQMNKNNIDFLVADRYYMEKGSVTTKDNAARMVIKGHEFSAIVLPPVCIIPRAVSNRMLEFARKGGVVIILGELPQGSVEKGLRDDLVISQMQELKRQQNVIDLSAKKDRMDQMVTLLNTKIRSQIRLENAGRLYTSHRKIGNNDFYWLSNNTDSIRNFTVWLRDGKGAAEIWDCETGQITPVEVVRENNYNRLSLTLQPVEGYWVVFDNSHKNIRKKSGQTPVPFKEIILDEKWTLSFPGRDTIYKTAARIQDTNNETPDMEKLKPGYDDSAWEYYRNENHPRDRRDTTKLRKLADYIYWRTQIPIGSTSVTFPAGMIGSDVWIDGEKKHLTENVVRLKENAALLSFFTTTEKLKSFLTSPFKFEVGKKDDCRLQSWHSYGLQQYTGYVDYETAVKVDKTGPGVFLDLGNVKYMAEVFVNDKSVGARLWPPFKFDLAGELKTGDNKIRIRIGNLMVDDIWLKEDLGKLRTWGWNENPDFDKYDAGLQGPVKLLFTK